MPKFLQPRHLALLVSLGVFALVVWAVSRKLEPRALLDIWQSSDPVWLGVAVAAMAAWVIAGIFRTRDVAQETTGKPIGAWPATRVNWITLFVGLGAPIAAVADIARIGLAKVIMNVRVGEAVQIALYDKILGVLGMVLVGICLMPLQIWAGVGEALVATQSLLWMAGVGAVGVFAIAGRVPLPQHWIRVQKLADIVRRFLPMLMRPAFALRQFGFAWLYILTSGACLWALGQAMGLSVGLDKMMMFTPVIMFVSSLPIFYAGWGGREAVVLATIGNIAGVSGPHAVALSIAYGVVFLLVSLFGGAIWLAQPLPPLSDINLQVAVAAKAEQPGA